MSKIGLLIMSGALALGVSSHTAMAQPTQTNAQQTQNVDNFRNRLDAIIKKLDGAQKYYLVQGPSAIVDVAISKASTDLFSLLVEFGETNIIMGDSENAKYLINIMNHYLKYNNHKSIVRKSVAGALVAAGVWAQPGQELRIGGEIHSKQLLPKQVEGLHVQAATFSYIVNFVKKNSLNEAYELVKKHYSHHVNAQVLASNYVTALSAPGVLGVNRLLRGNDNLKMAIAYWFASHMNLDVPRINQAERDIKAALSESKNSDYYDNVMALLNRSPMKHQNLRRFLSKIDDLNKNNKGLSVTDLSRGAQILFYAYGIVIVR